MIISFLYFFLSLLSVQYYQRKDYKRFIIVTSLIIFKGFGFIPFLFSSFGDPNTYNFLLISIVLITMLNIGRKKNFFKIKGDEVAKAISWILGYQLIITIISGIRGVDSWINVFGQYRFSLVLLLYFILRPIPINVYIKLITQFYKLLITVVVCYICISIFGFIEENPFKNTVFVLAPVLLFILLFESLPSKIERYKIISIAIVSIGIFLLLARGLLIAIIVSIILYTYRSVGLKKSLAPLLIVAILTPVMMNLLDSKKNESRGSNNISTEIELIQTSSDYSDYKVSSGALRFISVVERLDYMCKHPFELIFGIGVMKESTAQDKLQFISGTNGVLEEGGRRVTLQLDTDDVGLLSSFMRFGLCYILLFIILCIKSFKRFNKFRNCPLMKTGYLTLSMMLFAIPFTSFFFADWTLFPLLIFLALSGNIIFNYSKPYATI